MTIIGLIAFVSVVFILWSTVLPKSYLNTYVKVLRWDSKWRPFFLLCLWPCKPLAKRSDTAAQEGYLKEAESLSKDHSLPAPAKKDEEAKS